ncbi:prepilin-type cleavage/methylation domain-containing protein [Thermotoga sp. SG1]|uniref:prepilin-type cleavage/methylation domain-containing protein n=1 Tax=Thermotoga sp. SG1 TaxID=126739 RepID=UPI000C77FD81|nr:prepilin-type cleavage/methylation domain-containing protein [Thermotoga sp. SG1]PLV56163.1 hypothetical protein AS006_06275 [Thermotoga sp. SG1]
MRNGFTITEVLITMVVLLITVLLILGIATRVTIVSAQSLTTIELADDLLKAAMELRKEIIKAGPKADEVSFDPSDPARISFKVSVPFAGEDYGFQDYLYVIVFNRPDIELQIYRKNPDNDLILEKTKILVSDISTCTFFVSPGTISFTIGKKKNSIERTYFISIALSNLE